MGDHLPDDTVSSLPKLLGHSVALIDDEILVENLEHLATLQISHGAVVWVYEIRLL